MSEFPHLIEAYLAECDANTAERLRKGYRDAQMRPTTLRANTLKASKHEVAAALREAGIAFERVPWYEDAFVLPDTLNSKDLWGLEIYQRGGIYLQSLSSMLPPLAFGSMGTSDILDMCAAPGGKTSQLAALNPHAHITACELKGIRAEKLKHNLNKQGAHNVIVMKTDARKLDSFFSFDAILLDAPCTGSGTYRAHDVQHGARITPALLAKVLKSQQALLERGLSILKPGGTLIYSTCSILPAENDTMVQSVLAKKRFSSYSIKPVLADEIWRSGSYPLPLIDDTRNLQTVSLAPSKYFEGFYLARIVREA
ncbi:RsmB/NOP family class I SAM-dependent RNA methyltransferase [Collinsella sp. zg1085]|uniref:RsmB/NOP family class I SAM-dependent RNA methyltransferase n=1 Tax=Collinsella sp. zg1085 TaxID=2844380 RepID=UPI001C0ADA59|nr:RsmB/NOP family class I SAM-dependent RNA methyltransferase [Collinsella sp. zg1085]QWT17995.1 RsmB/NOP family class I SAM-dependent RNA methyltransferase [Collinsella sp. zg1085]